MLRSVKRPLFHPTQHYWQLHSCWVLSGAGGANMASAAAWQPSGAQVFLNVYDLTTEMNSWTYWCGVGVFHAGVEVYGIEYAYGGK